MITIDNRGIAERAAANFEHLVIEYRAELERDPHMEAWERAAYEADIEDFEYAARLIRSDLLKQYTRLDGVQCPDCEHEAISFNPAERKLKCGYCNFDFLLCEEHNDELADALSGVFDSFDYNQFLTTLANPIGADYSTVSSCADSRPL